MLPFKSHGEDGAEFCCLAYVPIRYRQRKTYVSGELGIYFCSHKQFTQFSQHCFANDQSPLAYTRGDDRYDTLPFILLTAFLDAGIHPSMWRLFPRTEIPNDASFPKYEEARQDFCRILFHFRTKETAVKLTADMPHAALITPADATVRLALGDCPEEDAEFEQAILNGEG